VGSLFVIQGADQGKRFELNARPMALGRDASNPIRLHDTEVSRRHAELRPAEEGAFRIVDLGSANGTFVNGQPVDQAPLRTGDQLRLGRTVLLYSEGPQAHERDLTQRVDLLNRASPDDRSAILRSIPASMTSHALEVPGTAADWLKIRLANLSVMYQATQAISHILDQDALLSQVLQLVFESIGADRGAILLADEENGGNLVPKAVRWRGEAEPEERLTISRTIVEHVHKEGQGVISTDAPADARFAPSQSIMDYLIREAICVPIQGRHTTLGVLYADIRSNSALPKSPEGESKGRFTQEHLMLMVAIGHQAGLAIENTTFYNAKLQAERLAAVGQTIATLSHHIKNILQGLRGGSHLIDMGLNQKDEMIVRRGWTIVEKNQSRIYDMVMDMLSFSKDREPVLEPADLNEVVGDVMELMQSRARDLNVKLEWQPGAGVDEILIDTEGIHRAVLNIVTNALDATEDVQAPKVTVSTAWDAEHSHAIVTVVDNGVGIAEAELGEIFQIFASTKGTRGTGLGLPVSRKIVREHGGQITVSSELGKGSRFVIEIPARKWEGKDGDPLATLA
jgi:signal transduction histidine kinase/pSer/pThr/pTyr-binding forkhead associated (FHA) protein